MLDVPRAAAFALLLMMSGRSMAVAVDLAAGQPAREVLPDTAVPLHYDLALFPDAAALSFRGTVRIAVDVRTATANVVLNAMGLTFDKASVDGGVATVTTDVKLGQATLHLKTPLSRGRHSVAIDYSGKIGRTTLGFFAMDYSSAAGPRRTLATNFEPASARQLLPCWDEPGRKATFTLSVDAPMDRMAISNMPIAEVTEVSSTLQRIRFAQTPRMSTYLLFLAVGDFERIHRVVAGVDVGIVVKRGDTPKATYALDQAERLLRYYDDYFGIAFPLPKLDLIAAPGQIQGGSMENWGAIFYSQNHLLFDPTASTEADRQEVFLVVSHEMAHQWFGDLVTMSWWDNLWLNEGFARWMQTFAADDLHPEWDTGLGAASIFEQGKQLDSTPATHPVVQPVFTAEQAQQSFDNITYDKGAAIITMINAYVGRDQFREGVRRYMRAHAYGNTVDSDLWTLMQEAAGKPILAIERDFTRQEGLPLVEVARTSDSVSLRQSRFVDDRSTLARLPAQQWLLPLAVRSVAGATHTLLLHGNTDLDLETPLLVNAGQLGYTRVSYGEDLFSELVKRMSAIGAAEQMGLLNDQFAFGFSGDAPASNALRLAVRMPADGNPLVWQRIVRILGNLDRFYGENGTRKTFRRFGLDLLAPLAARIGTSGVPDESPNVTILRSALMETQATFADGAVLSLARQRFESGKGTAAEQRSALVIVAESADEGAFDALLKRAHDTLDPLQKQHIFQALAGVADPALARRMMDIALSDQIPAGSAPTLLSMLSRRHADALWQVMAPRLDDPTLPFDTALRWRLAMIIAGQSADPRRVADLEAYEERSVPVESRKPFLQAIASISLNRRFKANSLPEMDAWIAANSGQSVR